MRQYRDRGALLVIVLLAAGCATAEGLQAVGGAGGEGESEAAPGTGSLSGSTGASSSSGGVPASGGASGSGGGPPGASGGTGGEGVGAGGDEAQGGSDNGGSAAGGGAGADDGGTEGGGAGSAGAAALVAFGSCTPCPAGTKNLAFLYNDGCNPGAACGQSLQYLCIPESVTTLFGCYQSCPAGWQLDSVFSSCTCDGGKQAPVNVCVQD
jgi:hypothetical protein